MNPVFILPVALALGAPSPSSPSPSSPNPSSPHPSQTAPRFSLQDQFKRPHTHATVFRSKPVVLVGGDERKTREALALWVNALRGPLGGEASLLGIVDLDGVPFFVPNGSVRKGLRRRLPKTAVLCDWDGEVYPRLGFAEDTAAAARVFDASGEALGTVTGPPTAQRVQEVLALVAKAKAHSRP